MRLTHRIFPLRFFYLLPLFVLLPGCAGNKTTQEKPEAKQKVNRHVDTYDWEQIQDAGEFIIGTLSGPETYFEIDGNEMGLHYALARNFAEENGLHLQIVVAHTQRELIEKLHGKEIDLIAYPLTEDTIRQDTLVAAGARDSIAETSWYVRRDCPHLAKALNDWYSTEKEKEIAEKETDRISNFHIVKFVARPMFLSKDKAHYSSYDEYFKRYGQAAGLDWRLVASVCYAESGYDPEAISNAGAQGLMQLMPTVAKQYGVTNCYDPEQNIKGGTLLLKQLMQDFADVDGQERIKFVLAAYNAGGGHIRDAMSLTRKYGKNPKNWTDVNEYILKLQRPEYYRDPVVRYGYMVGKETSAFVARIINYYHTYGGTLTMLPPTSQEKASAEEVNADGSEVKQTRYKKNVSIAGPDDPMFVSPTPEDETHESKGGL